MKFRVDVDCTPQELRTFLGLPDVEPMQQAVMDEMQRRMVASMDQFTPTTIMKDWFAPMTAVQQAFTSAFTGAGPGRRPPAATTDSEPSQSDEAKPSDPADR